MQELRDIVVRERRVLVGQRPECHGRVLDDPRAVIDGDLPALGHPVGEIPGQRLAVLTGHADAELATRGELAALRLERPVIDPHVVTGAQEVFVGEGRPRFAPLLELRPVVPVAALRPEPVRADLPGGEEEMRVRVVGVVAVHSEVRHHALRDELLHRKVPHERHLLRLREFNGECHLDLAGELSVLALLHRLDGVPERTPVDHPGRCTVGRENLRVVDAGLFRVVKGESDLLVAKFRPGPVGGRGDDGASGTPGDDLGVQVVDRHSRRSLASQLFGFRVLAAPQGPHTSRRDV